ncbi:MAG: ribosomal protein S18-alanine N-acetyltransferase [Desulfovibrio sp.]|nr:ribosomal protein S18-alanine N-acetyltransferase [Desulfovibrio sp.]
MHALEAACFSLPWSIEQCRICFSVPHFAAIGLFLQTRLVAYLSLYHIADEMEILNFAVLPALRRQGLGRFLLTTTLHTGKKMGMQRVSLEVREHNVAAIGLYAAVGFQKVGVRKHYYTDTGENAYILQKTLS